MVIPIEPNQLNLEALTKWQGRLAPKLQNRDVASHMARVVFYGRLNKTRGVSLQKYFTLEVHWEGPRSGFESLCRRRSATRSAGGVWKSAMCVVELYVL